MRSLALVAKGKKTAEEDSESDLSESEISKEDKALLVSDPKKFYKKNFSRFRNKYMQSSSSSERPRDENFKNSGNDDDKKQKKLLGDSGYDCNYCHGKNHFAKECMLRKQNEKSEIEKNEAYYVQKIEELRKKNASNAKPALIVQEGSDEDGRVEVWSTDSEDDEVRKPTHGGCFKAKSELQSYEGKCLMVQNGVLEQKGYATDGAQATESCFAAKPVSEQVKQCEKVVDKGNI